MGKKSRRGQSRAGSKHSKSGMGGLSSASAKLQTTTTTVASSSNQTPMLNSMETMQNVTQSDGTQMDAYAADMMAKASTDNVTYFDKGFFPLTPETISPQGQKLEEGTMPVIQRQQPYFHSSHIPTETPSEQQVEDYIQFLKSTKESCLKKIAWFNKKFPDPDTRPSDMEGLLFEAEHKIHYVDSILKALGNISLGNNKASSLAVLLGMATACDNKTNDFDLIVRHVESIFKLDSNSKNFFTMHTNVQIPGRTHDLGGSAYSTSVLDSAYSTSELDACSHVLFSLLKECPFGVALVSMGGSVSNEVASKVWALAQGSADLKTGNPFIGSFCLGVHPILMSQRDPAVYDTHREQYWSVTVAVHSLNHFLNKLGCVNDILLSTFSCTDHQFVMYKRDLSHCIMSPFELEDWKTRKQHEKATKKKTTSEGTSPQITFPNRLGKVVIPSELKAEVGGSGHPQTSCRWPKGSYMS